MNSLSNYQKQLLIKNPFVERITSKHVVYTSKFKTKAVKLTMKGRDPDTIFKEHGINPSYFKPDYCRCCIKRWVKKYNNEGSEALKNDRRGSSSNGGRPSKVDYQEYTKKELLAVIDIQNEVITDLKKKKALAKKKY